MYTDISNTKKHKNYNDNNYCKKKNVFKKVNSLMNKERLLKLITLHYL